MASHIILEACLRAYTGFEKNERAPLVALFDPEIVFEFPETVPYGGRYEGIDAYQALWRHLYANYYQSFDYDLHVVIDGGDHVVVPVTARAVSLDGRTMDYEQCLVFKLAGDRIVAGRVYADTAKVLAFLAASP
jgi:ketosteroid isomerase-like protein